MSEAFVVKRNSPGELEAVYRVSTVQENSTITYDISDYGELLDVKKIILVLHTSSDEPTAIYEIDKNGVSTYMGGDGVDLLNKVLIDDTSVTIYVSSRCCEAYYDSVCIFCFN